MCELSDTQASPSAMARTLCELEVANLEGRVLVTFPDGSKVTEPTYLGEKVVLDLAPGEDDWLGIVGVDKELTEHFSAEEAKSLCFSVQVSAEDAEKLDNIDNKMKRVLNYSVMRDKLTWKNMHNGGNLAVMNLVLEDTAQPTVLKFIETGRMMTGSGKDFLTGCLHGKDLTDFKCKPKVLLECVHDAREYIAINVTVLSIIFAPRLRRKMVEHSEVEDAAAMRSAARFRYEF